MALWNITCFNDSSTLPTIVSSINSTNITEHLSYNRNGRSAYQLIGSSIFRAGFSIDEYHDVVGKILDSTVTLDVLGIVNLKPIKSTIIYTSIALALFLAFSLILCIRSCCPCCKHSICCVRKALSREAC